MMGLLSSIKDKAAKALDVLTVSIAHPVKTIGAIISPKTTVKDVVKEHFSQSLPKQITQTVLGTVGIASSIVGGAAIAGVSKAKTVTAAVGTAVKSLLPTTTKGKVITAIAAPVALGAVVKEPTKTVAAIVKAPSELAQFGGDVATFISKPSVATAKEIIKESPLITAGVATAGLLAIGTGILPAVSSIRQTEAIQEQTKAIEGATLNLSKSQPTILTTTTTEKPFVPTTPVTPATTDVKPTSGTTRKRTRRKSKPTNNINQNVKILIANKNSTTTKNYLKRSILA